jgi:hypothetical protein
VQRQAVAACWGLVVAVTPGSLHTVSIVLPWNVISHTDCLVNAQDQACRLRCCLQSVDLDQTRLPDEPLHVVRYALCCKVDTSPDVALLVFYAESVENVRRVDTGVIAELPGNDLEGLCKRLDNRLLLMRDVLVGVVV